MEPHQKMHHLFRNLLRRLFILIGHDIFREGVFKPYALTFVMYAWFTLFFIGAFYTMALYDLTIILNMIAFLGLACEVIILSMSLLNIFFSKCSSYSIFSWV